jgi:cold shock CspA family protein/ribosome-associated translation inhibitor RaiA
MTTGQLLTRQKVRTLFMELPLQITFKDVPHSDAVEAAIRERVAKLERYSDCIISCRVIVQEPTKRRQQGNLFCITIDLTLPGAELALGHGGHGDAHSNENVYVAMRDSFHAMERMIKAYMAQRRHENKVHVYPQPLARVSKIFPQDGYGFLTTSDGRDIYFHTNSVLNGGWEQMDVGTEVRFAEELGDNGPQATTVECLRRSA